jgi:HTH-type transcriptional regulator/antitoxin HigA
MDAKPNTPQMDELEVLTTLVEVYEEQHYAIDAPDPAAILLGLNHYFL